MWKKAGKRLIRPFVLTVLCLGILSVLLDYLFPLPPLKDYSLVIKGNRNELVHAYLTKDEKWRMFTRPEEISPLLKKTLVAKEDKYFYRHPGVNPVALVKAFCRNILHRGNRSGASTITMQVAKMLDPSPRTIGNKLKEIFRAFQLEWYYSKADIFNLYCNMLPYGGNIEGIKAAAYIYLGKDPDHLSLAEITTLSILPNRPSAWRIGRHNDRLVEARNKWLKRFAASGLFTGKEISDALEEPLEAWRKSLPRQVPHLAQRLRKDAGKEITTTININMQSQAEALVEAYIRSISYKNIHNAAVLIVENETSNVLAYIGSSGFHSNPDGGEVDGTRAVRQPGSTLKPFLYGRCIEEGIYTPKSVIYDVPVFYDGYAPENYDRRFNGEVTLEYALEHSLNIPAVKSMAALGKDKFINSLAGAGFRTISSQRKQLGLSVALGGCGATLEELTGLFAAIARSGTWLPLRYTSDASRQPGKKILNSSACFMLTEILSRVNRPDFPLHWETTAHLPRIAWKTGTSYGRRDAWSIGFNKKYTIGVWTGNFSGASAPDLSGAEIATPLLFRIFNAIDYNSPAEWYTPPPELGIRMVCAETGQVPSGFCPHIVSDYYIPLVSSMQPCENRKEFFLSPDEKISYCMECLPGKDYKKKLFRIIPPALQAWYEERKINYDKIPPHNPRCEAFSAGKGPVITSPRSGSIYYSSVKNPDPVQLSCQAGNEVLKVYWYINKRFYKAAAAGEKLYFTAPAGPVEITCTDDKGRSAKTNITIEPF